MKIGKRRSQRFEQSVWALQHELVDKVDTFGWWKVHRNYHRFSKTVSIVRTMHIHAKTKMQHYFGRCIWRTICNFCVISKFYCKSSPIQTRWISRTMFFSAFFFYRKRNEIVWRHESLRVSAEAFPAKIIFGWIYVMYTIERRRSTLLPTTVAVVANLIPCLIIIFGIWWS